MIPNAVRNVGARRRMVPPRGRLVRVLTLVLPVVSIAAAGGLIHGWAQPGGRVVPVEGRATADAVRSLQAIEDAYHRGYRVADRG